MNILQRFLHWASGRKDLEDAVYYEVNRVIERELRKALARWHQPADLYDDLQQELWERLLEKRKWIFEHFRGRTEGKLRRFLRTTARRASNRFLSRLAALRKREPQALAEAPPTGDPLLTEAEIQRRLAEIEPQLSPALREELHELLGDRKSAAAADDESAAPAGRHAKETRKSRLLRRLRSLLFEQDG